MRSQHAAAAQFASDKRPPLSIHVAIVEDDPSVFDVLTNAVSTAPDLRLTGMAVTRVETGFTTPEIAKLMQLSRFTVRTFVRRIYGKLKVNSKAEAIYEARTLGLLAS